MEVNIDNIMNTDGNYVNLCMQAANTMRCDHCGGKHRRYNASRPWYSARFCDRCRAFHSAKEVIILTQPFHNCQIQILNFYI